MKTEIIGTCSLALALTLFVGCSQANAGESRGTKTAESSVSTNDNGSISRTFVESSVTTNGNLVTERRRETRTNLDSEGNILETSTSEYAQSYNVGDTGWKLPAARFDSGSDNDKAIVTDGFIGLKFGDVLDATNTVREAGEPSLLRIAFKPKKALPGFNDYYAYVTPKTHKVAKICACAKDAIEPGGSWRRHYLLEALEKRYGTWARLISYRRPYYAFDIGSDRTVTICLAGASPEYQTVITAWDNEVVRLADEEQEELRKEARKAAANRRDQQIKDAADIF